VAASFSVAITFPTTRLELCFDPVREVLTAHTGVRSWERLGRGVVVMPMTMMAGMRP